ncbi:hypothetical protein [Leifsonia sp. Leaf264]|uniref:hypothetical protein n=1 Tax=Leifsonia sp. Leaf264 TaxID=1736314 RepID=UPI0006F6A63C|nr:hypothetical protein [Leifsonia sp. Leaf264]KQO98317.1 hypothetical protein ASF30_09665 [Leifsonia sp. Leaf264]
MQVTSYRSKAVICPNPSACTVERFHWDGENCQVLNPDAGLPQLTVDTTPTAPVVVQPAAEAPMSEPVQPATEAPATTPIPVQPEPTPDAPQNGEPTGVFHRLEARTRQGRSWEAAYFDRVNARIASDVAALQKPASMKGEEGQTYKDQVAAIVDRWHPDRPNRYHGVLIDGDEARKAAELGFIIVDEIHDAHTAKRAADFIGGVATSRAEYEQLTMKYPGKHAAQIFPKLQLIPGGAARRGYSIGGARSGARKPEPLPLWRRLLIAFVDKIR